MPLSLPPNCPRPPNVRYLLAVTDSHCSLPSHRQRQRWSPRGRAKKRRARRSQPCLLRGHGRLPMIHVRLLRSNACTPRSHNGLPRRGRLLALTVRPLRHQWRSASFPSRFFWTSRGHWPPPFAGFPSSFIGECWDAALEYHGGTADDGYWKSWDEGIGSTLPTKPVGKLGMTPDARENLVWELTMFLDISRGILGQLDYWRRGRARLSRPGT